MEDRPKGLFVVWPNIYYHSFNSMFFLSISKSLLNKIAILKFLAKQEKIASMIQQFGNQLSIFWNLTNSTPSTRIYAHAETLWHRGLRHLRDSRTVLMVSAKGAAETLTLAPNFVKGSAPCPPCSRPSNGVRRWSPTTRMRRPCRSSSTIAAAVLQLAVELPFSTLLIPS